MTPETDLFTYDRFVPDSSMGVVPMIIDDAFLALWRRIYPSAENAGVPVAVSTVILMRAWRTIVDPRPPGNVHAGQEVQLHAAPELGELVNTEVRCLSKEEKKGRLFVKLETVSTGRGGRPLFSGQTTLIWAA